MIFKRKVAFSLLAVVFIFSLSLPLFAAGGSKININTASVEELGKLEKVGEKYAQRIVEYREANGPFEQPQDITKVKGIGDKTWEANQDLIVVE